MTQVERVFTASIGEKVFCGLIHITVLNWLVWYENFLLKFICFIFHQESAILGRIRLPHAGSLFYLFQDESLFSKVSIRLLDITACCINSVQGHQVKPLEGHAVAIRNDSDQHLGYRSGWSILLSPSSYHNGWSIQVSSSSYTERKSYH